MSGKKDRFDLEFQIMNCWQVVEDLKLIGGRIDSDTDPESIKKHLIALGVLVDLKFDELFDTFEELVSEKADFLEKK